MCYKYLLSRQSTSLQNLSDEFAFKPQVKTPSLHYPICAWGRKKGPWKPKDTPKVSVFRMMGFVYGILLHGPSITVGSIITISITSLSLEQASNVAGVPLESIAKLDITLGASLIYENSWIAQLQSWNLVEMNIWPPLMTPLQGTDSFRQIQTEKQMQAHPLLYHSVDARYLCCPYVDTTGYGRLWSFKIWLPESMTSSF